MKLNEYGILEYSKSGHSLGTLALTQRGNQSHNRQPRRPSRRRPLMTIYILPEKPSMPKVGIHRFRQSWTWWKGQIRKGNRGW